MKTIVALTLTIAISCLFSFKNSSHHAGLNENDMFMDTTVTRVNPIPDSLTATYQGYENGDKRTKKMYHFKITIYPNQEKATVYYDNQVFHVKQKKVHHQVYSNKEVSLAGNFDTLTVKLPGDDILYVIRITPAIVHADSTIIAYRGVDISTRQMHDFKVTYYPHQKKAIFYHNRQVYHLDQKKDVGVLRYKSDQIVLEGNIHCFVVTLLSKKSLNLKSIVVNRIIK